MPVKKVRMPRFIKGKDEDLKRDYIIIHCHLGGESVSEGAGGQLDASLRSA